MHSLFQKGNPLSLICEWQNAVHLEGISGESTGFRAVRGVLLPFVSTATSAGALRILLTALFQILAEQAHEFDTRARAGGAESYASSTPINVSPIGD
jgi:hypothetical protein